MLEFNVPLLGRVELRDAKRERVREFEEVCVDARSWAGDGEEGRD